MSLKRTRFEVLSLSTCNGMRSSVSHEIIPSHQSVHGAVAIMQAVHVGSMVVFVNGMRDKSTKWLHLQLQMRLLIPGLAAGVGHICTDQGRIWNEHAPVVVDTLDVTQEILSARWQLY